MTYAPDTLQDARTFLITTVPGLSGAAVGIVGDTSHAATGTSYHLGEDDLADTAYSIIESSRDKNGLTDAASALDVGWFSVKAGGKTHTLRTFSAWLVAECEAGAADTRDIREVIYTLDGKTVKRWDRLGRRTSGDSSHLYHTHISYFRDSEKRDKTALFRRYLTEIGLLEDDTMPTVADVWAYDPGKNGTTDANGGIPNVVSTTAAARKANTTISPVTALYHLLLRTQKLMDGQTAQATAVAAIGTAVATLAKAQGADTTKITAALDALSAAVAQVDEETVTALLGGGVEQLADLLAGSLGADDLAKLGALLTQAP
ncbi:hypothetical protein [Actinoplanes sp. NPDC051851]|uniref:hypothetical protein n=1 Tax=Actinoplanes sp. NPDC051851 TaxID=3154753 RepID=UPI003428FC58